MSGLSARGRRVSDYAPLAGDAHRAAGRPDHRQGLGAIQAQRRQVDRPPPRAAVAALHPRPEFSGRQSDRSRDRGTCESREPRRRRARSAHDPRQSLSRERPGRQGDHGAPGAAAAAESQPDGTGVRPALPRPRLQARRLRRSRARSVQRGASARSRATATRSSTCRRCRRNSISGPMRSTRGSASRS